MAIIKCKMCGGDLLLTEGSTVAECEYCGSVQTVPTADNEKKLTLFARAGRLRAANEFDKAAGVYESIVADFPEEAEAYWGLVLCKFGIEYVDDPATGKKVPTCHRSGFDSVMKDADFEQACENADPTARRVYREEAKAIEEIRRRIIEVSGREEPYDIFICYKETDASGSRTVDSVIAQNVYDKLTDAGYRVFFSRITLEDKLGLEYEPYIFAALNSAKVMLVFGTDYEHFNAVWVKNEWSRFLKLMAADKTKYLIPCYKDIDAYDMPEEFAHLQAQDMGKVGAEQDLIRGIKKLLPREEAKQETVQQPVVQQVIQQGGGPTVDSLLKRAFIFLGDGDFGQAEAYFNKALDIDPENSEANIGLMLKDAKVSTKKDFERAFIGGRVRPGSVYYRAKRFGGKQYADWFAQMEQARRQAEKQKLREEEKLAEQKRLEEERKRREAEELAEQKRLEEERKHKETINRLKQARERIMPAQKLISAGSHHTVGLRTDGTVVATKYTGDKEFNKNYRQCEISGWKDIIDISTGCYHTVGLRANGTVVAVGHDAYGQCGVSGWKDIVAVSAGLWHTVGVRADGSVVATKYTGMNNNGQCEVSGWKDIVAISAGKEHTVGLRADGTVVATEYTGIQEYYYGRCEVSGWKDIVAISAGKDHTVGLRADGTVVSTGWNLYGQCEVGGWKDIVAISAGNEHTVGLRADGTVIAVGNNNECQCEVSGWRNIVAVSAGDSHTVCLQSDGTVVATKYTGIQTLYCGQCEVSGWKLFNSIDTLEQEHMEMKERRKQQLLSALAAAQQKKAAAESELANLKGLFSGKRRKELEIEIAAAQRTIAEAAAQLNKLG